MICATSEHARVRCEERRRYLAERGIESRAFVCVRTPTALVVWADAATHHSRACTDGRIHLVQHVHAPWTTMEESHKPSPTVSKTHVAICMHMPEVGASRAGNTQGWE